MSRYQLLTSNEKYVTYSEVSNVGARLANTTIVSPKNPVPKPIPNVNGASEKNSYERGYKRATTKYGPNSRGHASLRYYGNGVY